MRSPVETASPFDSPAKAFARRAIVGGLGKTGLRVEKLENTADFVRDDSTTTPEILARFGRIPGMISHRRGIYYYLLAYAQGIRGDIVELGCWQGRSTAFLAQACLDADNGQVHAIDTFAGNPGNETAYKVGRDDLSDLAEGIRDNLFNAGVMNRVTVHMGDSVALATTVSSVASDVRMLVVDAEHTYDAVKAELDAYAGLVVAGGLLVFDDYSARFEGVARAIGEHLSANAETYARPLQDRNLLVLRKRLD